MDWMSKKIKISCRHHLSKVRYSVMTIIKIFLVICHTGQIIYYF